MKTSLFYLLITSLVCILYANTISVPWHLDDKPNIIDNPPVQIDNLLPATIVETLYAFPFQGDRLYRPAPMFSFALNYFIGQENTYGYHIVNIALHVSCALLLFLCILNLFQSPVLTNRLPPTEQLFIAGLTTILWAVHPIQTQAVTYIVQRMAIMATLFYLLGIFSYLKIRLAETKTDIRKYALLLCLSYLLAIGSKENAAILPLSLALIEFIFFGNRQGRSSQLIRRCHFFVITAFFLGAIYYFFSQNYHLYLFTHIGSRPFTILERLLTQPAILLFYLSLIFYPLASRFSIDHDITFASSIFAPWYTAPSLLTIAALILGAFALRKRLPLVSFALLFFFLNHAVESSFIPLELIFEHRNYLPSTFIFMPLTAGASALIFRHRLSVFTKNIFISGLCLLIILLSYNTYLRNQVWASEFSLWQDAFSKAPNSARAASKLGELIGWQFPKTGKNLEIALAYYKKSLEGHTPRTSYRAAILGNMGELCFIHKQYDRAIEYYRRSLELNKNFFKSRIGIAKSYLLKGDFAQSEMHMRQVDATDRYSSTYFNLYGMILIWEGENKKAQMAFRSSLALAPQKQQYFYNNGVALSRLGYTRQAEWFLRSARKANPTNIFIHFSLIEHYLRHHDAATARHYAYELLRTFPPKDIVHDGEQLTTRYEGVPIDINMIRPLIQETGQSFWR